MEFRGDSVKSQLGEIMGVAMLSTYVTPNRTGCSHRKRLVLRKTDEDTTLPALFVANDLQIHHFTSDCKY